MGEIFCVPRSDGILFTLILIITIILNIHCGKSIYAERRTRNRPFLLTVNRSTPEEQENFIDLWKLQKKYVENREKDQRKEDELRKSLTKKYTLHKENPEIEKRIGYAFYKLAKENEGLFKVLYEVASDSNSRAQLQTIMMRNYQYKEWND